MKIKIDHFRGVFRTFEKNTNEIQKKKNFFKLTKIKIKIVVLYDHFQLLEKKDAHRSSFWDRPEWKSKSTILAAFCIKNNWYFENKSMFSR